MMFSQSISEEIFRQKYMINGEKTPEDVFRGVATEIAMAEKPKVRAQWEHEFLDIMEKGLFIPGGRILANARPDSKMKYYNNCYTIAVGDSMEGIFGALHDDAMISASGGGVGFNISYLRPKDAAIKKGGKSSGPISFLKIFNESAKVIQTGGGRRSAHIALMNIDHPDIEEFITVKHGDEKKALDQFNLSVVLTDEFIRAVEEDSEWPLVWEGQVYKIVKAKYLYDLLAKNAFEHNEPGIFNIDTVNRYNNGWYAFNIDSVNPCVTGDTIVDISFKGVNQKIRMKDLVELVVSGEEVFAKSLNEETRQTEYQKVTNALLTRKNTKIIRITDTSTGNQIKCTPDHKILTKNRGWVEAQHLQPTDELIHD